VGKIFFFNIGAEQMIQNFLVSRVLVVFLLCASGAAFGKIYDCSVSTLKVINGEDSVFERIAQFTVDTAKNESKEFTFRNLLVQCTGDDENRSMMCSIGAPGARIPAGAFSSLGPDLMLMVGMGEEEGLGVYCVVEGTKMPLSGWAQRFKMGS
jgi:hypothetical protein